MNNLDIVKVFPYKIPANSNEKILVQDGGNITTNSNLTLPDLDKQFKDLYLINTTTTDVNLYVGTTTIGKLPAKNYIFFTPNNLGTQEYVIAGQGLTTLAAVNEKLLYMSVIANADTQGTEKIVGWSSMNYTADYDSGVYNFQTITNPNTALGFRDTSVFIDTYAEFNITLLSGGYGSLIFRFYDENNLLLATYRVYRPDKPAETIAGDPAQEISATVIRPISKGDYFTIWTTSGNSMESVLTIKKLNNITI